MGTGAKTIVTIGIIIGFIFLFGVIVASSGGGRPGIFGLILAGGMIAALRAVWKKPSIEKQDDNQQLDKTS